MSFYVFSGSDRVKTQEKIKKILGEDYEVFEGAQLGATELMEICSSASLFANKRKILIKDLTQKAAKEGGAAGSSSAARAAGTAEEATSAKGFDSYEILMKYANSPHEIVIWETNLSRKKTFKEFCALKQVRQEKIDAVEKVDRLAIFRLFDEIWEGRLTATPKNARLAASANGFSERGKTTTSSENAILRRYHELNSDPYLTVGALASWSVNKYKFRFGAREKRLVKAVAELDMQTKSSKIAPELLVEAFLTGMGQI